MSIQNFIKPNTLHRPHGLNYHAHGPNRKKQLDPMQQHVVGSQLHAAGSVGPQVNQMQTLKTGAPADSQKAAPLTAFQADVARRLAEHQPK